MPAYTLAEIMSIATGDIGRRADIPVSVVSTRANIAYFEVANAGEFAMQERVAVSSTTSGENRIELPPDFGEPINVSMKWSWSTASSAVSSTKTLARVSVSEIDANNALPVGEPQSYAFFNNWIELFPSPDSAYSLQMRYRSMVTDMIATTDVPSISTPGRYAIVLKLKELLHDYLGNYAASAAAEQKYLNYMTRAKSDEYRRQMGEQPMGLQVVTGSASGSRRRDSLFDLESF
jgi:hypothetical protein